MGDFRNTNRAAITSTMTKLAVRLMFSTFAKIWVKVMGSPPHAVDDLLQLVDFILGQLLPGAKGKHQRRQRSGEGFLNEFLALVGVVFLLGDQRSDLTVLHLEKAFLDSFFKIE